MRVLRSQFNRNDVPAVIEFNIIIGGYDSPLPSPCNFLNEYALSLEIIRISLSGQPTAVFYPSVTGKLYRVSSQISTNDFRFPLLTALCVRVIWLVFHRL